jgi:hypothetical protein
VGLWLIEKGDKMKVKTVCLSAMLFTFLMASTAFSLQYTFQPRVSTSEEYTSNVFLSEDNEKDDWITTVSAGFTAGAIGKTGALEVSYDPAYKFYRDYDENDGWTHDARLNLYSNLTKRTRFEVRDSFLRTQDPLAEEDILALREGQVVQEGDTTVRKGRNTYYTNRASTRLAHQFGEYDLVYAGFLYSFLRNNDSQEEDNDRYQPEVGLNYWFGPKFGIESNAVYTKGNFKQDNDYVGQGSSDFDNWAGTLKGIHRINTRTSIFAQHNQIYRDYEENNAGDDDYLVYAPSAGFTYIVEEGLNLRLGGGYFYQKIDGDGDNQGFFGNSQIDKTWTYRRGSIKLAALTGLDQNDFGSENIGLERYVAAQGSADYQFTRILGGYVNGFYRYSDAVGNSDQNAGEDTGKNVQRYRAGAGFVLEPLRWMEIRLGYNFNKVNSDNEADEYTEHRGLLKITLTPSQPYRYSE